MLKSLARKGLHLADDLALALASRAQPEGDALVSVLFHSLYRDEGQLSDPSLAPNQNVTVENFRAFVGGMLERGYTAVSPAAIDAGLACGGKYLAITFDDGYFNNTLALDVLQQFEVPATFFVSADHVLQNKAFWWDALHRQLASAGAPARVLAAELRKLKSLPPEQIEQTLRTRFGASALRPRSDLDRPFAPGELRDFARSRWVHIGNHTCNHAILTNCAAQDVRRQISGCQEALQELVGYAPIAIAYPNGNFSESVVDASLASGLRVGFTVLPHRNKLPLTPRKRMTLGRVLFEGEKDVGGQCRKLAASFIPSHLVTMLIHSQQHAGREPGRTRRHA
jgi:peptidoglycan/xylan/chitin deacetylase (PgdA/CDA1 family)